MIANYFSKLHVASRWLLRAAGEEHQRSLAENRQLWVRSLLTPFGLALALLIASLLVAEPLWAQATPTPTATAEGAVTVPSEDAADEHVEPQFAAEKVLTLGGTADPLQQKLGDLVEVLLNNADIHVVRKEYTDLEALLVGLERGETSLGIGLPLQALVLHYQLPLNALPTDSERLWQFVDNMAGRQGVQWLSPMLVAQDYALFAINRPTTPDEAPEADPSTIGVTTLAERFEQIQQAEANVTICSKPSAQQLWRIVQDAIVDEYQISEEQFAAQVVDEPMTVEGLLEHDCDLFFGLREEGAKFSTDSILTELIDRDHFWPPNHPSLISRQSVLDQLPAIEELWMTLVNVMDDQAIAALAAPATTDPTTDNAENTDSGEIAADTDANPRSAAYTFLLQHNLVQLPTIAIGTRDETAQALLGAIVLRRLSDAGYPTIDQIGAMEQVDVIEAVEEGESDVVIALLGEVLTLHMEVPLEELSTDLDTALIRLSKGHDDHGYTFLPPFEFSLTRVLLVDKDLAGLGITTLARLANYMNQFESPFTICVDSEFYSHPITGLSLLEAYYGFHFDPANILLMDEDTIFTAIQDHQCQVTVGTITDGRIAAWNLLPLQDDKQFFPPNNPIIVINGALWATQPQLATLVEGYIPLLDTATMQQLTALVEVGADGIVESGDELSIDEVVQAFLRVQSQRAASGSADSGIVTVGELTPAELNAFEELPGVPAAGQSEN